MSSIRDTFMSLLWLFYATCVTAQQVIIPKPNGTYTVGMVTLQVTNLNSLQPFAPGPEAPALELSVFYPTNGTDTVDVPYMPSKVAGYEDAILSGLEGIDSPAGTLERLVMQLAPDASHIATGPTAQWPLLIFGSGLGVNRNFYNTIVSQVASNGYVVISFDTPYDTDIVLYSNGSTVGANLNAFPSNNDTALLEQIIADVNVRAQDTSYIIGQFSNTSFASSIIPGCDNCLNTTHVGLFGHSLGGAISATTMLNDTRVAGALDFDGSLWGDVVEQGLNRPFMLVTHGGVNRSRFVEGPRAGEANIWPKLTAAKFDIIVNNTMHLDFSDWPYVFELLGIMPTNATLLEALQLSDMNGTRAHHITTTYATAFFDWLLKNGSPDLVAATSPLFPEVTLDTDTTPPDQANGLRGPSTNSTSGNGTTASGTATASGGSPTSTSNAAVSHLRTNVDFTIGTVVLGFVAWLAL